MKVSGASLLTAILAAVPVASAVQQKVLRRDEAPSFNHLRNDGNAYLDDALDPDIFHNLGQYSPRYTVTSDLQDELPRGCEVVLVNSLERHGARYMTSGSLKKAQATLSKLQAALAAQGVDLSKLPKELRFLPNATILPNTADLVPYGALQSFLSGRYTAQRYSKLAEQSKDPVFIRTTGTPASDRVIVTSRYWSLGFSGGKFPSEDLTDGSNTRSSASFAGHEPNVIISEAAKSNNTLDVSTCTADDAYGASYGEDGAIAEYGASTLVPRIGSRLSKAFAQAGASVNVTSSDIQSIGNLCGFDTLNRAKVSNGGDLDIKVSPYCSIFRRPEWQLYNYALDVGKYYGSGYGDPYHRGIATGYLRELLARLTSTPVIIDSPSAINTTLDAANAASTFPIPSSSTTQGPHIFFDGSHDNNISPIAAAFGLFSSPHNLSTAADAESTPQGRSRAWTFSQIAPLQGKIVWEKVQCNSRPSRRASDGQRADKQQYIRVRANEAIQKAQGQPWCPDAPRSAYLQRNGLCPLDNVVKSLDWVKSGDEWAKCFK